MGPGIHRMTADAYHADPHERPSLSSTLARVIIDQSPRHAWTRHPRLNPDHEPEERKVFDIGRAAHRAVLGAGDDYVAIPAELLASNGAASTKEAKAWIADARASGLIPLKADECDQIGVIADAVRAKLDRMRIVIDPAHSELVALAEIDGCPVRAMIDNAPLGKPYLLDLKTTIDASPEGCIRAVVNYGLDVQARFYLDAWEAATGERRKMRFVFVEKDAPHEVGVVELHDGQTEADWYHDAAGKCAEARRIWVECLTAGQWPGYPDQVAVIGAPGWYRQKWADRETGLPVIRIKPSPETIARVRAWQAP